MSNLSVCHVNAWKGVKTELLDCRRISLGGAPPQMQIRSGSPAGKLRRQSGSSTAGARAGKIRRQFGSSALGVQSLSPVFQLQRNCRAANPRQILLKLKYFNFATTFAWRQPISVHCLGEVTLNSPSAFNRPGCTPQ